jgi:hypothetical protein
VALLDAGGAPRSAAAIDADLARELAVWDAGTEANQVGAAGPDQAPRQAGPNTGAPEGSGLVRRFADPRFRYPAADRLLRITIRPIP